MSESDSWRSALKVLIFSIPFMIANLTDSVFTVIDRTLLNQLGEDAIVAYASFMPFVWISYTFTYPVAKILRAFLARDVKNAGELNTAGFTLEAVLNLTTCSIYFFAAEPLADFFFLSPGVREGLVLLIRMHGIARLGVSFGSLGKSKLQIENRMKAANVIVACSSIINVVGDFLSVSNGWGLFGIYCATIASAWFKNAAYFIVAKPKLGRLRLSIVKDIFMNAKDLMINKMMQRVVNLGSVRIASKCGEGVYVVYSVVFNMIYLMEDLTDGFAEGNMIAFSRILNEGKEKLVALADKISVLFTSAYMAVCAALLYPLWWMTESSVSWDRCVPYVWVSLLAICPYPAQLCYQQILYAKKKTSGIRTVGFIGGIVVRLPLYYLVERFGFGVMGFLFAYTADGIARALWVRCCSVKCERESSLAGVLGVSPEQGS